MKTTATFFSVLSVILIACAGFAGCEQIHRGIDGPVVIVPGEEEPEEPEDPEDPDDEYKTNPEMNIMWAQVLANATGVVSRDICEFLVEAAASNWPQDELRVILLKVASLQIRNRDSVYYGNFLWRTGDTVPVTESSSFDINGALFCGTMLTLLRVSYYHKLDTENKALLDEIIPPLLEAAENHVHDRRASYTNTWVMRTWVLCGMGEALGDNNVLNKGKASLREWMRDIYTKGIAEFNSGIYSQVSARALGCLANLSKDNEIKREAGIGLRYFSRLHWGNFVSYDDIGTVFGGPQSRNYNFMHSRSEGDMFQRMLSGQQQGFFDSHAAWTLSAEDTALYQRKNRTLIYRYGLTDTANEDDRFVVHYVGSKFSMGSSGRPYGNEDKTYVINLFDSARPALVHISTVMDGRDDPYGESRTGAVSRRPWHFSNHLSARAQRLIPSGSEMVFLAAADHNNRDDTDKVNHFTVIPKIGHDGFWDGNAPVDVSAWPADFSQELSSAGKAAFFIRFDDVAVGIRYLKVLDIHGNDALSQVRLVNRPYTSLYMYTPIESPMIIQAQLSTGRPATGEYGIVAAWWRVKEGILTDEQFAVFRNEMINASTQFEQRVNTQSVVTGYTVKVNTPDGELGVSGNNRNINSRGNRFTASYGDNVLTIPSGVNFMVNGVDLTSSLFEGSEYIGN